MPTYRVISEPQPIGYALREDGQRRLRGDGSIRRRISDVAAFDISTALRAAIDSGDHEDRLITSVEETLKFGDTSTNYQELSDLLRQETDSIVAAEPLHPADWESDEALFETPGFLDAVDQVAAKLAETRLPGLFVTYVEDLDGGHALIQMRDEATGRYLVKTAATEDLIHDLEATGWSAILSIASAILYQTQELV
ncbi:hypothetical protein [Arthrobacter koreensis]|uniref:hypothetical protein n=1 Tax=Arthrobacter koreensis TaxID=199136 RepID=UPI00381ECFFB